MSEHYVGWDDSLAIGGYVYISPHPAMFAAWFFVISHVDFAGVIVDVDLVFTEVPYNAILSEPISAEYNFIHIGTGQECG